MPASFTNWGLTRHAPRTESRRKSTRRSDEIVTKLSVDRETWRNRRFSSGGLDRPTENDELIPLGIRT